MKGTLVKKGGKVLGVEINGTLVAGGQDERGLYIEATCRKCGKPFRSYLAGKGPLRAVCDDCRARKGSARVEGDTLVMSQSPYGAKPSAT